MSWVSPKPRLKRACATLPPDLGEKNIRVNAVSGGADQDACGLWHWRLSLHPAVERIQRAAASNGDDRRSRRKCRLPAFADVARRDRRDPPRRRRLPHRGHEEPGSAGHRASQGISGTQDKTGSKTRPDPRRPGQEPDRVKARRLPRPPRSRPRCRVAARSCRPPSAPAGRDRRTQRRTGPCNRL